MAFTREFQSSRRDFIKLMSSLGLVTLTGSGCALLSPVEKRRHSEIALRNPERIGRLTNSQLGELWQIFDYIGEAWESREFCSIQEIKQLEAIITLKTTRIPSYFTEYLSAISIFKQLRKALDPQQALHHLYFEDVDEHLKRFVVEEFLRLQIAYGGFRFLPYQNVVGFTGGSFRDDEQLPYRGLDDSC
jgi:hypothetical protein